MRNVYDAYEAGQKGLGKRMACGIRPRLMLRTLLVVACLLCGTFTYAYDFEVDGIYYNILSSEDKTCEVTYRLGSGRSYTGDIVIPHEVVYEGQTLKVTSIGDYAFFYCSGLTSVTIPESITNIGDNAFMSCFGLTEVNVDNGNVSYTSIDGVLFSKDLSVLHQFPAGKKGPFTIPESVTSIGVDAFRDCSGLTSVIIGESVTTIGDGAFYFCSGLTSVTIPESVTSIGGHTFQDCFGLTSVTIPNSVTSIGDYAFYECI